MTDILTRLRDATERWLPAPGFEGLYSVSSFGRVRSERTGKFLKGSKPRSSREYPCVNFHVGERANRIAVHRLVATAFLGYPPNSSSQVRHKDGDHMNSAADNLLWGTAADNARDRERHGRTANGSRHGCAKLSEQDVRFILNDCRSTKYVATDYGVHRTTIQRIRNGRRWATLKARMAKEDAA